ncbi:MAG: NAD(P)-dependent oxidoreductase [Dehalococcoidia bacterium]
MEIGFIGLGNMGNPMARNLVRAGHSLTVHDLREDSAANLLELGASWATSPRAVAERCTVLFTSLPGPAEVERVVFGPDGILEGARAGTVLFDLSSNAPSVIRSISQRAAERGVTVLDAPVSGGVRGAREGTLAVMVGGDKPAFDTNLDVLKAIGTNVFHLGGVGNGAVVKLMNNLISLSIGPLLDEAVVTAVKAGIPPRTLFEVMSVSSAGPLVRGMPRLFAREFDDVSFALALAAKDIGLAVGAGRELGVPMPIAAAVEQVFLWAKGSGLAEKNSLATLLLYERAAGVEVQAGPEPA